MKFIYSRPHDYLTREEITACIKDMKKLLDACEKDKIDQHYYPALCASIDCLNEIRKTIK